MNPEAEEFIPKGSCPPLPGSHHGSSGGQQQQQPPNPVTSLPQTKLRASAQPFQPKTSTAFSPMGPMLPYGAGSTMFGPQSWEVAERVNPVPMWKSDVQQQQHQQQHQAANKALSLSATPYTPTNPKISSRFPATPECKRVVSTEVVNPTPPASLPQEEKGTAEVAEKEEVKVSPSKDSPVVANGGPADSSSAPAAQNFMVGEIVENDFSGSMLPSLFGVKVLNKTAPAEPTRFNTVWALYADEHPTPFGAPLAYQPVLVHLVGDVESFWRLWRHLPPPSTLLPAFTYHWFRRDIKPNWEHPRNKNGGTISFVIFDRDKPGLNNKQMMDDAFMVMLMACSGEELAESTTNLNGVMLKVRQNKPTTLQIWTANSDELKLKALVKSLRLLLEKVIGSKPLQKLEYYSHQRTQVGTSSSLAGRMKGKSSRTTPDFTLS